MVCCAAGAAATIALALFLVVYGKVSKPVNVQLTAAATMRRTPEGVRTLQARRDGVIHARVFLQAVALVALEIGLVAA